MIPLCMQVVILTHLLGAGPAVGMVLLHLAVMWMHLLRQEQSQWAVHLCRLVLLPPAALPEQIHLQTRMQKAKSECHMAHHETTSRSSEMACELVQGTVHKQECCESALQATLRQHVSLMTERQKLHLHLPVNLLAECLPRSIPVPQRERWLQMAGRLLEGLQQLLPRESEAAARKLQRLAGKHPAGPCALLRPSQLPASSQPLPSPSATAQRPARCTKSIMNVSVSLPSFGSVSCPLPDGGWHSQSGRAACAGKSCRAGSS